MHDTQEADLDMHSCHSMKGIPAVTLTVLGNEPTEQHLQLLSILCLSACWATSKGANCVLPHPRHYMTEHEDHNN